MFKTENVTLSANDKLSTLSDLGTMLSAGIPLLESVEALLEDAKKNQKKFLEVLRDDLNQGKHVYFTFSKFPNIFSRVIASIVNTGTLLLPTSNDTLVGKNTTDILTNKKFIDNTTKILNNADSTKLLGFLIFELIDFFQKTENAQVIFNFSIWKEILVNIILFTTKFWIIILILIILYQN